MNPFFEPATQTHKSHRNLPHWTQLGKMYFVTFRLADSLPQERLEQIRQERAIWSNRHSKPYSEQDWQEYHRLFSERIESWLDAGHGECILANPGCSTIVADVIRCYDGKRYRLDHWVIMPNHVHALLIPHDPHTLGDILHSWKSFTANQFMKKQFHAGQLWQHESFDHIVRSREQLERFRQYAIDNYNSMPGRATLSTKTIV